MISVEETDDSLADYAASLGWDEWGDLVKKKLITVVTDDYFSTLDLPGSLEGIMEMIQKTDATRMVLDWINLSGTISPRSRTAGDTCLNL